MTAKDVVRKLHAMGLDEDALQVEACDNVLSSACDTINRLGALVKMLQDRIDTLEGKLEKATTMYSTREPDHYEST